MCVTDPIHQKSSPHEKAGLDTKHQKATLLVKFCMLFSIEPTRRYETQISHATQMHKTEINLETHMYKWGAFLLSLGKLKHINLENSKEIFALDELNWQFHSSHLFSSLPT